jgi:hypothetical protein
MDRTNHSVSRTASAEELRRVAFRHGVSETRLIQILADRRREANRDWSGDVRRSIGPIGHEELANIDRSLQIAGAAAWSRRVKHATGAEALFDRNFRFVAVSQSGRTLSTLDGDRTELPEDVFIGTRYGDLLPVRTSLLGDEKPGFDGLHDKGFFSGRLLGVQIHLEMNFGVHHINCIMELWAVQTPDQGILAHSTLHPKPVAGPAAKSQGLNVFSVVYH